MDFAKINSGGELLVFPYNFETLKEENPHTKYTKNSIMSIKDMYETTEDFIVNNNVLVEVTFANLPEDIDLDNNAYIYDDMPTLIDGSWIINYTVEPLSAEIKQANLEKLNENKNVDINVGTHPE